jgi:hypothetical protein
MDFQKKMQFIIVDLPKKWWFSIVMLVYQRLIYRHLNTQIISQVSHLAFRTPHLEVFTEMPHAGSRFVEEAERNVGELPRTKPQKKHRTSCKTEFGVPSGKHTKSYGKSPFSMGKLIINGNFQ